MPNVRAAGKSMLGAQVSRELREAVDKWLEANPSKNQSDFIVEASLEKLEADKIPVDREAVLRDGRSRLARIQNKGISSKPGGVGAKILGKAAASVLRPSAK